MTTLYIIIADAGLLNEYFHVGKNQMFIEMVLKYRAPGITWSYMISMREIKHKTIIVLMSING